MRVVVRGGPSPQGHEGAGGAIAARLQGRASLCAPGGEASARLVARKRPGGGEGERDHIRPARVVGEDDLGEDDAHSEADDRPDDAPDQTHGLSKAGRRPPNKERVELGAAELGEHGERTIVLAEALEAVTLVQAHGWTVLLHA